MSNSKKVVITEAQLQAIREITDECSAMIGSGNPEDENRRKRWIMLVDRMLKNNKLQKREFL